MRFVPYLNFSGQCEAAFRFYQEVFGGEITAMYPHRGTPASEHVSEEWQDKIMHARLEAGDAVLMGSDSPPEMFVQPQGLYISMHPDSIEEAERIYAALAEGGSVLMPLQETFWAPRFAMFTDRFGTPWMINCVPAQQ